MIIGLVNAQGQASSFITREAIIARLAQIIIIFLFSALALAGLLISLLGLVLPGLVITAACLVGIWAESNTKKEDDP